MKLGPARKVRAAGLEIEYRIARSAKRVRSITVQVKPDGAIIARAPAGISTERTIDDALPLQGVQNSLKLVIPAE